MNKIAIFTDIHGNEEALEAILFDIKNRNIKDIYSLGDILGIGPSSKECLDIILDENIINTLGNHEDYYIYGTNKYLYLQDSEIRHHEWIKSTIKRKQGKMLYKMPRQIDLEIYNKLINLCHFPINKRTGTFYRLTPYKENGKECFNNDFEKYDKVIYGHNHIPFEEDNKFINLSSSGCVHSDFTSYIILDLQTGEFEKIFVPFDKEKLAYKIEQGYPSSTYYKKYFGL